MKTVNQTLLDIKSRFLKENKVKIEHTYYWTFGRMEVTYTVNGKGYYAELEKNDLLLGLRLDTNVTDFCNIMISTELFKNILWIDYFDGMPHALVIDYLVLSLIYAYVVMPIIEHKKIA